MGNSPFLLFLLGFAALIGVAWLLAPRDALPEGHFNAGSQSNYPPGSITYLDEQHVYLIRLTDGAFVALYDWDAKAQMHFRDGDERMTECRVEVLARDSQGYEGILMLAQTLFEPVEGLEDVVLRGCYGSSFDPLGRRTFGPVPSDLDRFPVAVNRHDDVIINVAERICKPESPCLAFK